MKSASKGAGKVQIDLQRPYAGLALGVALFGGGAAFFLYRAESNQVGLIINGIITLEPGGADIFYFIMGLLSLGMALVAAWSIIRCAGIKEFRILIGKSSIKFPASPLWKTSEVTVPLDRVTAVEMQPAGKPMMLVIHEDGGRHVIPARWLPDAWPAQDVAEEIIERVRKAQRAGKE
jgi:hypothetical protein